MENEEKKEENMDVKKNPAKRPAKQKNAENYIKLVDSIDSINHTLTGTKRESAMFYVQYLDKLDTFMWIMRFIALMLLLLVLKQFVKFG